MHRITAIIVIFVFGLLHTTTTKVDAEDNLIFDLPQVLNINQSSDLYFELPPSIIQRGNRQLNVTTTRTYTCHTPSNPLETTISLSSSNCTLTQKSELFDNESNQPPWFRNYAGTFTNHLIRNNNTTYLYSINHGENKNEIRNNIKYQNTINPNVSVDSCASQVTNGQFQECRPAYFSFVTLSYASHTQETNYGMNFPQTDLGPITWPTHGYYGNNHPASSLGYTNSIVRHPTGITTDTHLYIFYHEWSTDPAMRGIKVIRAPLNSLNPNSFTKYCNNDWLKSLPDGFTKDNIANFYQSSSACSTSIIPESNGTTISFATTKINANTYLGVREIASSTNWRVEIYQSQDLINWRYVQKVMETTSYALGSLHYPLFLNAEGTSNAVVDPNNFYLMGTDGQGKVITVKSRVLSLPGNPSSIDGDLNSDGKVDIFDYQRLISNFGNPYTIFDYQKVISNFGR